jgi:hypothetical protein
LRVRAASLDKPVLQPWKRGVSKKIVYSRRRIGYIPITS